MRAVSNGCNVWKKVVSLSSAEFVLCEEGTGCLKHCMPKHSDYVEPCGIDASGVPECTGTSIYNEECCAWRYQNSSGRNSVAMGMC